MPAVFFWLVSDKERELGEAQTEIRALRLSERAREKAVEEVIPNCFLVQSVYRATMWIIYIVFNPLRERERNAPKRRLMREKGRIVCCYFSVSIPFGVASRSDVDCGK